MAKFLILVTLAFGSHVMASAWPQADSANYRTGDCEEIACPWQGCPCVTEERPIRDLVLRAGQKVKLGEFNVICTK